MFKVRKRKHAPWNEVKTVQNLIDFCKVHRIPTDTELRIITDSGKRFVVEIYFHEISGLTLNAKHEKL